MTISSSRENGLCLFGAGGHGRVVAAIASRIWQCNIIFGDTSKPIGSKVLNLPIVVSNFQNLKGFEVIITIGDVNVRRELQLKAVKSGLKCAYIIASPENFFAEAPGRGSMVLTAAVVHPGAQIGEGTIINTNALIEHDCEVGDFCNIAPSAVLLGECKLGNMVNIGANATILPGVVICSDVTVGAGAVVTRDITEPGTYIGLPAQQLK